MIDLERAVMLLRSLDDSSAEIAERHKDPIKRLQDHMSGQTASFNAAQEYTLRLASAHALVAIAQSLNRFAFQVERTDEAKGVGT